MRNFKYERRNDFFISNRIYSIDGVRVELKGFMNLEFEHIITEYLSFLYPPQKPPFDRPSR